LPMPKPIGVSISTITTMAIQATIVAKLSPTLAGAIMAQWPPHASAASTTPSRTPLTGFAVAVARSELVALSLTCTTQPITFALAAYEKFL